MRTKHYYLQFIPIIGFFYVIYLAITDNKPIGWAKYYKKDLVYLGRPIDMFIGAIIQAVSFLLLLFILIL